MAAVKAAHPGAAFFAQLWHTGRVAHNAYMENGGAPYGPSAIMCPSEGGVMLPDYSTVPYVQPREMTKADIDKTIADYVTAAQNALAAGFDGVEFHSANGYLAEQFLRASSNQRTDEYGPSGGPHGRATFSLRVVSALVNAIGADRVGIRLSPWGRFLIDAPDVEVDHATCDVLVKSLASAPSPIAYIHMIEPRMCLGTRSRRCLRPTLLWTGGARCGAGACSLPLAASTAPAPSPTAPPTLPTSSSPLGAGGCPRPTCRPALRRRGRRGRR